MVPSFRSMVGAATVLVLSGCIALLDLETAQCQNDNDCRVRGGAFSTMVCNTAHLCQDPDSQPADASSGGASSSGDAQASSGSLPARECEKNSHCMELYQGEPRVCDKPSGTCMSLTDNEHCPYQFNYFEVATRSIASDDPHRDDSPINNVVVLGTFFQLLDVGPTSHPLYQTYSLAFKELGQVDLPPGGASTARRPLVAVLCNGLNKAEPGLQHLVGKLHVPAVIGYFNEQDTDRFYRSYFLDSGTFLLNGTTTPSTMYDGAGLKGRIWNMLGAARDLSSAYAPTIKRVETYLRTREPSLETERLRIAVVRTTNVSDVSVVQGFQSVDSEHPLVWNESVGSPSTSRDGAASSSDYLSLEIPEILALDDIPSYTTYVDQLLTFRPHIIVAATSGEFAANKTDFNCPMQSGDTNIVHRLHCEWPTDQPRPFLVGGRRNAGQFDSYLKGDLTARYRRFVGVNGASTRDEALYSAFIARGQQVGLQNLSETDNFYDAVYWLAYGGAAAGPGPVDLTGDDFARGVRNLLSGSDIYAGTRDQISAAFRVLTNEEQKAKFRTLMNNEYDISAGRPKTVGGLYCYKPDGLDDLSFVQNTMRYDPAANDLVPAENEFCFSGFVE